MFVPYFANLAKDMPTIFQSNTDPKAFFCMGQSIGRGEKEKDLCSDFMGLYLISAT